MPPVPHVHRPGRAGTGEGRDRAAAATSVGSSPLPPPAPSPPGIRESFHRPIPGPAALPRARRPGAAGPWRGTCHRSGPPAPPPPPRSAPSCPPPPPHRRPQPLTPAPGSGSGETGSTLPLPVTGQSAKRAAGMGAAIGLGRGQSEGGRRDARRRVRLPWRRAVRARCPPMAGRGLGLARPRLRHRRPRGDPSHGHQPPRRSVTRNSSIPAGQRIKIPGNS